MLDKDLFDIPEQTPYIPVNVFQNSKKVLLHDRKGVYGGERGEGGYSLSCTGGNPVMSRGYSRTGQGTPQTGLRTGPVTGLGTTPLWANTHLWIHNLPSWSVHGRQWVQLFAKWKIFKIIRRFLVHSDPNTGQLNPLFHTFAEFRLIVNRIVAR